MINNILKDGLIGNSQLNQNKETTSVDGVSEKELRSTYRKNGILVDESQISQEALNLYEKDKEIEKYKGLLGQITEEEANQQVASLMDEGIITISEEDLASSMIRNDDLINDLFQ